MSVISISVKNYKAFKEAKAELAPLTVFLGQNSVGKSSIIKLILLLSQSLDESWASTSKKPFRLIGPNVEFGDPKDLFRNLRTSDRLITINIDIDKISPFASSRNMQQMALSSMQLYISQLKHLEIETSNKIDKGKLDYWYYEDQIELKKQNEADLIKDGTKKIRSLKYRISKQIHDNQNQNIIDFHDEIKKTRTSSFKETLDIHDSIKDITGASLEYNFFYNGKSKQIGIQSISVKSNNRIVLCVDLWNNKAKRQRCKLQSDVIDQAILKRSEVDFKKYFSMHGLHPHWKATAPRFKRMASISRYFTAPNMSSGLLFSTLERAVEHVSNALSVKNIHHVVPVRAYPQRYYAITDTSSNIIGGISDPNYVANILKSDSQFRTTLNHWMSTFDVKIDIEELNTILHSLKVKQAGVRLDLTDVGFGISQILPVIVQSLSARPGDLIIVEQPEIHLHPKAQANLADFFIAMAKGGRKFIIETHSESLLRRLRRRMAESTDETLNTGFPPDQTQILFFERQDPQQHEVTIRAATISDSGNFEWPKSFKAPDIEDTIEFMKHQSNNV